MAKSSEHFEFVSIDNNESINQTTNGQKKRKKDNTAARRMRLYRQRLRGEIVTDTNGEDMLALKRPRAMTGAERIRLYRLRKKLAKENLLKDNEYIVLTSNSTGGMDTLVTSQSEGTREAFSHQICDSEKLELSSVKPLHIKEELDIGETSLIDGTTIKTEIEDGSSEHCNDQINNDKDSTDVDDNCFNPVMLVKIESLNEKYEEDKESTNADANCTDVDVNVKQEVLNYNEDHEPDKSLNPEKPATDGEQYKEYLPSKKFDKPIAVKIEPEIEEKVLPDSEKYEQLHSEIQFVSVKEEPFENSNSDELEHEIHSRSDIIECEFCDHTTESKLNMNIHMETIHHHNTQNYKCEYCDHSTSTPADLKKHTSLVHHRTKNHRCEYCNHATSSSSDLKKHINAVHHKIKNYKCQYCDYSASRAAHIELHIGSVHQKIKKYRCGYCDFTASTAWTLKRHIRSGHNNLNNDHKCEYCNYTASQGSTIKRHISAVHFKPKKYKCEFCDYVANNCWHVKVHTRASHGTVSASDASHLK